MKLRQRNNEIRLGYWQDDFDIDIDKLIVKKAIYIYEVSGYRKAWGKDTRVNKGVFLTIDECDDFIKRYLESGTFWGKNKEIGFIIEYDGEEYLTYSRYIYLMNCIKQKEYYKYDLRNLFIHILKDESVWLDFFKESRKIDGYGVFDIYYDKCVEVNLKDLFIEIK
jgi:hypothetical protein